MTTPPATVADLSEQDILARILRRLGPDPVAVVGPGDDAAVLAVPDGRVVATTDTLVHGPDFRLAWTGGYDLGWKAAAVNLADIAAMGARPISLLVALALPETTPIAFVESIADGVRDCCVELAPGCTVSGGDLTVSPTLAVAVTALGSLDGRAPVLRSGAHVGDTVAIAGDIGVAARGLAILFTQFRDRQGTPMPLDLAELSAEDRAYVSAQLRPRPPISAGPVAATADATAMLDVSDGLARDMGRIADASGVTLDVRSADLGGEGIRALAGGEDHALVATFPGPPPAGFRAIGTVVARADESVTVDGLPHLGHSGWDPYRDWDAKVG